MPIGITYQLDLLYEIPGKQGAMTMHFNQLTTGPGLAVADSMYCFDEVAAAAAAELAVVMPSALSFLGAYVRQGSIGTGVVYPFLGLFASAIPGSRGSGEMLPEGTGPLVLIGPSSYSINPRSQTNRKYFPVMLELDQEDGALGSDLVEGIEGVYATLFDETTFGSNFEMVTYSRKEDEALNTFTWKAETVRVSDQIARLVRRRPRYQGRFAPP